MSLWKVVDLGKAVRFGYIKYKWVLFGFFFFILKIFQLAGTMRRVNIPTEL